MMTEGDLTLSTTQTPPKIAGDEFRLFKVSMYLIFAVMLIGSGTMFYFAWKRGKETHARFMQQCLQDRKEYECIALWRSSDRTDLIMIPIPMPVTR